MRTAMVLYVDSACLTQQAGELNRLLMGLRAWPEPLELWLISQGETPQAFPVFAHGLCAIELIHTDSPHLPEAHLSLLEQMHRKKPQDLYLFPSDDHGAELATRLACRLGGCSCVQVEGLYISSSDEVQVEKPAYGSNLTARLLLQGNPCCIAAAKNPAAPLELKEAACPVSLRQGLHQAPADWVIESSLAEEAPPSGLAKAEVVLALGQGVGSRDNLERLYGAADALGAQLGASRPVVMNAWTGLERLIGASGLILSPKLCIAAGVSGSAAFSVGIKNSEFLAAVNTDPEAPIFRLAQVGVVEDLSALLLELEKLVRAGRQSKQGRTRPGSGWGST